MTIPLASAYTAAVLVVLQTALMMTVGLHRRRVGVGVGTGNDPELERKVRRHGNLAENSGLFLGALIVLELIGAGTLVAGSIGAIFVAARLAHAAAFSSPAGSHGQPGSRVFVGLRAAGAAGTLLSSLAVVVGLVWQAANAAA